MAMTENKKPLLHSSTEKALGIFLAEPASCLALIGERGSGKYYIATYICRTLLGEKFEVNPNFYHVNANVAGIEDVRQLQKRLTYKVPGNAKYRRIAVIEHFDSFGHEAQNALLKTLEEPPDDTMIILTIDHETRVLQTIYSRIQSIRIQPVGLSIAINYFRNDHKLDEVERAANISGGSVGLMHGLMSSEAKHELVEAISSAREMLKQEKHVRIGRIDSIIKDKHISTDIFLDALLRLLQASYKQQISSRGAKSNLELAHNRVETTLQAIKDVDDGVSQKLALTRLFLEL